MNSISGILLRSTGIIWNDKIEVLNTHSFLSLPKSSNKNWCCGFLLPKFPPVFLVTKAVVMVSAMNLANLMGRILVSGDPERREAGNFGDSLNLDFQTSMNKWCVFFVGEGVC